MARVFPAISGASSSSSTDVWITTISLFSSSERKFFWTEESRKSLAARMAKIDAAAKLTTDNVARVHEPAHSLRIDQMSKNR